jgi:hypothetical protein
MFETKFSNGNEITSYTATAYAEGFCEGDGASYEDQLRAWAYLIKYKICWKLQGFFGRTAQDYLDCGIISPEGIIDWSYVNVLFD